MQQTQKHNEHWVFQKHLAHDPFRENHDHSVFSIATPEPTPTPSAPAPAPAPKKAAGTLLKNAGRQIRASLIVLVIGFILLNWSALSQIAQSKWQKWMGNEQQTVLHEISGEVTPKKTNPVIISTDPEVRIQDIPALDLEIAPADNRLIIPRINQNLPVITVSSESLIKRDWNGLEKEMQEALRDGVVHYPGTSLPNQNGNVVITGHSSYFPWDAGRFKDVFALLHDLVIGDRIVMYYEQKKFVYEVKDIKVVLPEDINVLKQTPTNQLTLITCTPIGTNLKRLIVTAVPIEQ